jgi:hypothetical protein
MTTITPAEAVARYADDPRLAALTEWLAADGHNLGLAWVDDPDMLQGGAIAVLAERDGITIGDD